FGLARLASDGGGAVRVGTPLYMAPELWEEIGLGDARSDQYALGILAFECLSGRPPFLGTLLEVANAHAGAPLPPLASPLHAARARAGPRRPGPRFPSGAASAAERRAAAGLAAAVALLPPLPEPLRRAAATLPQPIAEAILTLEAARNPFQAAEMARA